MTAVHGVSQGQGKHLLSKAQTITTLLCTSIYSKGTRYSCFFGTRAKPSVTSHPTGTVPANPLPCRDTGFTFHRPLTSSPSGSSPSPATAAQPTQLLHISPSTAPSPPRGAHHDANRFLSLLWLAPPPLLCLTQKASQAVLWTTAEAQFVLLPSSPKTRPPGPPACQNTVA